MPTAAGVQRNGGGAAPHEPNVVMKRIMRIIPDRALMGIEKYFLRFKI
jgi:hypothetical protein